MSLKQFTVDETWRAEGEVEEPAIGARRRAKQETHRAVKSVWELCRTAQWCDAADAGRIAAPIACRVMRVHFGDRTAEMHHEHSDTPVGKCYLILDRDTKYSQGFREFLEREGHQGHTTATAIAEFECLRRALRTFSQGRINLSHDLLRRGLAASGIQRIHGSLSYREESPGPRQPIAQTVEWCLAF